jgi:hypothetical protein
MIAGHFVATGRWSLSILFSPCRHPSGKHQGDRILISSIDVDERFEDDRITDSWVVDQGSTLLLLLEI